VAPGQTLAGKYRIESVLGTGTMGLVLAATNLGLGARVAIEVMLAGSKKPMQHFSGAPGQDRLAEPALERGEVLAELDQVLDHHRFQVRLFHGRHHRFVPPSASPLQPPPCAARASSLPVPRAPQPPRGTTRRPSAPAGQP